eukprot:14737184-Ditylum_brightwellii.AAC.1
MADNKPDWTDDKNPVLDFVLETTQRKFANGIGCVETTVIAVECAAKDAACLKLLLTKTYEHGDPTYGEFIPTSSTLAVPVVGISEEAMWENIELNGETTELGK